jgi:hypothetical protein
MGTPR